MLPLSRTSLCLQTSPGRYDGRAAIKINHQPLALKELACHIEVMGECLDKSVSLFMSTGYEEKQVHRMVPEGRK